MDSIKNAFDKVKQEILELKQAFEKQKPQKIPSAIISINPDNSNTYSDTPTHIQTLQHPLELLRSPNMYVSTGNRGVPTDKPTDRQTNQQTDRQNEKPQGNQSFNDFEKIREILDSLDSAKKEIRLKFKRLTPQEMMVFSKLYDFQEQNMDEITYRILAQHLNLSESSIRDYIKKLTQKGIPVLKIRKNNKKIVLQVSPTLQNLASLSTIIRLRDL